MNPSPSKRSRPAFLDVTKPLFDTHGNLHHIILCSAFQLLTTYRGLFFVWDKNSGESLMAHGSHSRLSNERLPDGHPDVRTMSTTATQMRQSAMVIDCLRRSSRAEVRGWSGYRRTGGTKRS